MLNNIDFKFVYIAVDRNVFIRNAKISDKVYRIISILQKKLEIVFYDDPFICSKEDASNFIENNINSNFCKCIIFFTNYDFYKSESIYNCMKKATEYNIQYLLVSLDGKIDALFDNIEKYNVLTHNFSRGIIVSNMVTENESIICNKIISANNKLNIELDTLNIYSTMINKKYKVKAVSNQNYVDLDTKLLTYMNKGIIQRIKEDNLIIESNTIYRMHHLTPDIVNHIKDEVKGVIILFDSVYDDTSYFESNYITCNNVILNYDFLVKIRKQFPNILFLKYANNPLQYYYHTNLSFSRSFKISRSSSFFNSLYSRKGNNKDKNNKIFISYSHDDVEECNIVKIVNQLQISGANVIIDINDFVPGIEWNDYANSVIRSKSCNTVLCFLTENSFNSKPVEKELIAASENGKNIIFFSNIGNMQIQSLYDKLKNKYENTVFISSLENLISYMNEKNYISLSNEPSIEFYSDSTLIVEKKLKNKINKYFYLDDNVKIKTVKYVNPESFNYFSNNIVYRSENYKVDKSVIFYNESKERYILKPYKMPSERAIYNDINMENSFNIIYKNTITNVGIIPFIIMLLIQMLALTTMLFIRNIDACNFVIYAYTITLPVMIYSKKIKNKKLDNQKIAKLYVKNGFIYLFYYSLVTILCLLLGKDFKALYCSNYGYLKYLGINIFVYLIIFVFVDLINKFRNGKVTRLKYGNVSLYKILIYILFYGVQLFVFLFFIVWLLKDLLLLL